VVETIKRTKRNCDKNSLKQHKILRKALSQDGRINRIVRPIPFTEE
jgi:hypothetical protein